MRSSHVCRNISRREPPPGLHAAVTDAEHCERQAHIPEGKGFFWGGLLLLFKVKLWIRCWGLLWSTLVSAAAFSGSRRAGWKAQRARRAQPESSRTQPRRQWSVCTVLYPPWWLRKMVALHLWITWVQSLRKTQKRKLLQHNIQTRNQKYIPKKVPTKNTRKGTLMTGEVMLMNQLGRKGVILRKMM